MKVLKYLLGVVLIALIGVVVYIVVDTKPTIGPGTATPIVTVSENVVNTVLEVSEDVSEEDTSNTIEEAVVSNTYTVTKEDVTYYFMFAIPSNADSIISKVEEVVKEDFTECFVYYVSDDGESGNYNILVGDEMFLINVTL